MDFKPIMGAFVVASLGCMAEDAIGRKKIDYAECMSRPHNAFIRSAGAQCINGTLTDEDLLTVQNMAKAWTSFAIHGQVNYINKEHPSLIIPPIKSSAPICLCSDKILNCLPHIEICA